MNNEYGVLWIFRGVRQTRVPKLNRGGANNPIIRPPVKFQWFSWNTRNTRIQMMMWLYNEGNCWKDYMNTRVEKDI